MIRQDLLRAKAAALQLTVEQVAEKAGISRGTVYSIFKDPKYNPSVPKLLAVTDALGLNIADVINSTEPVEVLV